MPANFELLLIASVRPLSRRVQISRSAIEYSFASGLESYCDPIATIAPVKSGLGLVVKKVG
jgi:hypothetical protein